MIVSGGEALVDLVPHAVPGGGPMNVAIAASRLGAPSALVARISNDEHGRTIWDHLVSNEVDLRACERGDEPTARAIVEHTPRLSFRFEGDGTADTMLEKADLGVLGDGPHIVHGGTLGLFRGRTAERLATLAESHTGVISLDPNVRPQIIDDRAAWDHFHDRWVARTHVYRASDEDLAWIWPDRDPESCAEELIAGAAHVVILTRGQDGATLFVNGDQFDIPGRSVDIVDTVGAGDTFVAAVLTSLWEHGVAGTPEALADLSSADWTALGQRAVAAAAINCTRQGCDPPYRHELDG